MRSRSGAVFPLLLALGACTASDDPLQQPRPLYDDPPFVYPERLWDEGVEGETMLMVRVNTQGDVDSVYVHTTSGHLAMDSAAVAGAYELSFEPGRRGVDAVDVWVRLPVRFTRDGAAAVGEAVP